jgi:elongation factor Ts
MAGRIGVLIEVNCETDFVARNEIFQAFVRDISLHIAAANPKFLGREEIPESVLATEREIALDQVKGKPEAIAEKIVQGKIDKIFSEQCLYEQAFIKNPDITIADFVKSKIAELGENLVVRRFVRYAVGEEI